jgi:hypothetical protein
MKSEVWLYPSETAAWHFISIPKKEAGEIKKKFGAKKRGWGSLPVVMTIGKTSWKTSIFPDKRSDTYLLPLKAEVRKKEEILHGDNVSFVLEVCA